MEKAIALCRVSTRGQELDGNLEPQRQNVERAAGSLGAELVKVWAIAVSSRKGKNINRKDLLEMIDYCKRYKSVKYLIVDEVDRFMRSIEEYYWWKMEFKQIGVRLVHANRPDIDPDDDRAVFDELIDVYRAEQSNNERIKKTPEKQKARLFAGYYPSNPHTGYKKSEIAGLHIPDEPNWSAMRKSFKAMAAGECSMEEGLKRATIEGLKTKNYGPKAVGGRKIDLYRWKELMTDPYYCGLMKFSNWDLGDKPVQGLHQAMITPEEHEILVKLVTNKGKRFVIKKGGNPDYPLANLIECARCVLSEYQYPRLTSANQNNGASKGYKRYQRYRCRSCNLEILKETFHEDLTTELSHILLSPAQKDKLKHHARKTWTSHTKLRIEQASLATGRVDLLKTKKDKLMDIYVDELDVEFKQDIKEKIEVVKLDIINAEKAASEARNFEKDFDEFISFAFNFLDNLKGEWWKLDKKKLDVYKQMLFPSGIQLLPNKKVYIPQISPIYLWEDKKIAPKKAEISRMEGPLGLEPRTPCLKGRCSNQLSYGPAINSLNIAFLPCCCQC